MSQLEAAAKEQQRLDAILNRRAMGLYSSSGGTRTRAATTTIAPKCAAPATTRPPAAVSTATIGTGACARTTTSAAPPPPPPVPPRSPVMAPPPVPPRSPLLAPTTTPPAEKAVVKVDDSEACEDDRAYRAKCEKQRLDKYISGEWRLARKQREDSGVTKTAAKSSSAGAEAAERRRERDHKETCDVAAKRGASASALETELTLVSLFIDELVHLLRKTTTTTTTGYDNAQALSIVRKAKEVKDAAVNIINASTSSSSPTAARVADDVNELAGTIARLINGWREGTAVDGDAAGGVASQAARLQQQLRQLAQ